MSVRLSMRSASGFYLDSVALMRLSREIAAMPGVDRSGPDDGHAGESPIMHDAGLLAAAGERRPPTISSSPCGAETGAAAESALAAAEAALAKPRTSGSGGEAASPRSLRAALARIPNASLALISVPGDFAAAEARKAIRAGLDVMIFSDNVPVEEEVGLKREAHALGRLVMGPDCGTAIINGVPLAFANVVPRGDIGIIGASGTGTQEVSCLIAQAGQRHLAGDRRRRPRSQARRSAASRR